MNLKFKVAYATFLLFSASACYADGNFLVQKYGCMACHSIFKTKIGPSFSDISERYKKNSDFTNYLSRSIIEGTAPLGQGWRKLGKADLVYMPGNSHVPPIDAKEIAEWIKNRGFVQTDFSNLVSSEMVIKGNVSHEITYRPDGLQKHKKAIDVVLKDSTQALRGVLLKDLINEAGLIKNHPNDAKRSIITVSATDNYTVTFSWGEIFNSPLGESVIVFTERNNQPLDDSEGKIALISLKDTNIGPRHVKWLREINVQIIKTAE